MYKFINEPGTYMIDLIELNDTPYVELSFTTGYILFAYNPSNHLVFLRFSKTKDSEVMTEHLKELIDYLDSDAKIVNKQFNRVVMDDGSEFKSTFTELLNKEGIKIRRINPNKQDHLILAPLNVMCKFIRNQIIKYIVDLDKQSQDGTKELKIRITVGQVSKVIKLI